MRAAVLYGAKDFQMEELSSPEVKADECLIEVKACGVCHSEISQWETRLNGLDYPRYIGHEVAGVIIESGQNVTGFNRGERVAVWVDGKGYAEQVAAHQNQIFPLAEGISFAEAMAEPIGCTTNAINRTNIQQGDIVALAGTGFMGLIMLQQIKLSGAVKVIAIDIRDDMLELAGQLGADMLINPKKMDVVKEVRNITKDKGVDICFEVGGSQGTLDLAAAICRMEGKLVIFGYHPGSRTIKDLGYWNWMAFDIINAHFRDLQQILDGTRRGMHMLNADKVKMNQLITHRYKLEQINEAFDAAVSKPKGFVKSVITLD